MHVESFDSIEEGYASMGRAEDSANEGLLPPQVALRDDDQNTRHFVVSLPDCLGFGVATSLPDLLAKVTANADPDDPDDVAEVEYETEMYRGIRPRGYLTGTVHTIYGEEYGDTHVSQVIPISEEAFEEARRAGWKAAAMDGLLTVMLDPDQVADLVQQGKITPTLIEEIDTFRRTFG